MTTVGPFCFFEIWLNQRQTLGCLQSLDRFSSVQNQINLPHPPPQAHLSLYCHFEQLLQPEQLHSDRNRSRVTFDRQLGAIPIFDYLLPLDTPAHSLWDYLHLPLCPSPRSLIPVEEQRRRLIGHQRTSWNRIRSAGCLTDMILYNSLGKRCLHSRAPSWFART